MSKQARDSEKVRNGLQDIRLRPAQLYGALRGKGMDNTHPHSGWSQGLRLAHLVQTRSPGDTEFVTNLRAVIAVLISLVLPMGAWASVAGVSHCELASIRTDVAMSMSAGHVGHMQHAQMDHMDNTVHAPSHKHGGATGNGCKCGCACSGPCATGCVAASLAGAPFAQARLGLQISIVPVYQALFIPEAHPFLPLRPPRSA
jgi:hypothetical protein